jgi:hypothetical protein
MSRIWMVRLFTVCSAIFLLAACGQKNAPAKTGANQKLVEVPAKPVAKSASEERGNVLHTLTLSRALEVQIRKANLNPAMIRAQVVEYHDAPQQKTWERIEFSVAAAGDKITQVKPFFVHDIKMHSDPETGYTVDAKGLKLGGFTLQDQKLDFCSGDYASHCVIRGQKDGTFKIIAITDLF